MYDLFVQLYIYMCVCYVHPELGIKGHRSGTGKGAGPL